MKADIVIKSDSLFTALADEPTKGFVAVKGKQIIAVGNPDNMYRWIGPKTRFYDVKEKTVLPGFFDSHLHINEGFFSSVSVDLSASKSEADAAQTLFENCKGKGLGKWVTACGWHHMYWENQEEPSKESLDRFFPNTPVLCMNAEGHGIWVNSKALEISGITANTPDPKGGIIKRDKKNEPTGYLLETAAFRTMDRLFTLGTVIPSLKGIHRLLKNMSSFGITSIADMQNNAINNNIFKLFETIHQLPVRIHIFPYLYSADNQEKQWAYIQKLHRQFQSETIRACGVKIFCDGTPFCHTGLMLEPYSDQPESRGETLHGYDETKQLIIEAAKRGYSVRAHACGDGAVRLALDSFEIADKQTGNRNLRHAIEHIEVIDPDDIERFSKLDVIASVQPQHMEIAPGEGNNLFYAIVGAERSKYLWAFQSLSKSGARLALGTDMPVADINPLPGIFRAITRQTNSGYPPDGWLPDEKLTLPQALKAYTIGAAYVNSREHDLGSLEKGKLADIIVLDKNIFNISKEQIKDIKVDYTLMNGKVVFER
ncbi:amidohydrolase [bacterium]|nr:amidohydrolase [bacterium]